jgi:hypothetical protein
MIILLNGAVIHIQSQKKIVFSFNVKRNKKIKSVGYDIYPKIYPKE